MSNQPIYEKIKAYLDGELTGAELEAFEKELLSNPELAEDVELYQTIDMVLEDEATLNFQKIVQAEDEAFFEENTAKLVEQPIRKIGGFNRQWMIAASFLFLIVSAILLWQLQTNAPQSNQELFAQYADTYPLNEDLRSSDSTVSDFEKGIQEYQSKDFDAATQTFEVLVAKNEQDMSLLFCLANAYFNQNPPQLDLAAQQFQKIITKDSSIYVPKAKWYLALIALEKEDLVQAKTLLKEVEQSGDKFGKIAERLLKELEN